MPCVPKFMSDCLPAVFLVTRRTSRTGCVHFPEKSKPIERVHLERHHPEPELSAERLEMVERLRTVSSVDKFDDISITGRRANELEGCAEEGSNCDFVLMVDFPIRAEWCLTSADITESASWKDQSRTGTMSRTWDEFEILESLSAANKRARSFNTIDVFGKSQGSDNNDLTNPLLKDAAVAERKRFLRDVLRCHPDKGGTAESIRAVLEKRRTANRMI